MTNCFPFPNQNKPENIDLGKIFDRIRFSSHRFDSDLEKYQADIIRSLRRVNSDYLQVGFYDNSFNRSLAQSMVPYQSSIVEESVALVYGLDRYSIDFDKFVFRCFRSRIGFTRFHQFESVSFNTGRIGKFEKRRIFFTWKVKRKNPIERRRRLLIFQCASSEFEFRKFIRTITGDFS